MQNIEQTPAQPVSCEPWFCVLWSAAEVGLVWWAVSTGATGPGNVVKLFAAYCAMMTPIMLYAAATEEKADARPTWLKRLLNAADATQVLMLSWWGWWWCAVAYGIGLLGAAAYRDRKGKTQSAGTEPSGVENQRLSKGK